MKIKFVLLLIFMVLFTILVLQNSQETVFKVFLWQFSAALSLLTVTTGVLGIILGIVSAKVFDSKKAKEKELKKSEKLTASEKEDTTGNPPYDSENRK